MFRSLIIRRSVHKIIILKTKLFKKKLQNEIERGIERYRGKGEKCMT